MLQAEIAKKQREIVVARLELASPKLYFSDGTNAISYSRDDMINLIKKGDPIGIEFVKTEWEFIKAVKTGELIRAIS